MRHTDTSSTVKPTVNDIARVAGVSLATVDRVLNARSGVRAGTVEKVNKAIADLGYVRDAAAANLARQRIYRLIFILPETQNEFVVALCDDVSRLTAEMRHDRTVLETRMVRPFNESDIVDQFDGLEPGNADGVAVFGPTTSRVQDAVKRAHDKGIAVIALVADLPGSVRDHFVGIDNVAAGRTAASLMGRFVNRTGRILVITGSSLARDHQERRQGFDQVMGEDFPDLKVLTSLEGQDDPAIVRALLPDIFAHNPDICGIYSSAGGSDGLVDALKLPDVPDDLAVIAHELTPHSRMALNEGLFDAVISQDTGHLARSAIRLMKATVDRAPINLAQERIRIDIYMKHNIPPETGGHPER